MKNRFFARSCLLVGIVVGLWMCSKEPTVPPIGAKEPLYSVAKARAYYDGASCTTRTIAEPGPLTPGDYSLDWERAEVSLDSLLSSVDVPINMQYRYFRYLQPESDSVELVPIYSKLVVVKEHPTLLEGCYIRHLMPARSMRNAYPDYDYDALLNSRPKTDFTGVSLYTDLNGWPMCMAYYYEGDLLFDAFLFDKAHTLEENIERLYNLIDDLTVARCSQVTTRAQQESPVLDRGKIEDVIILPEWELHLRNLLSEISITNPDLDNCPKPTTDDGGNGGGGSGSSSGSSGDSENNSSEHNENIKFEDEETKEIIEPLLDSISQDCMGKTLLDALDGVTIKTHEYDPNNNYNRFDPDTNTIHLESHKTYGFRDYVLLEELIHRYQIQQQGDLSIGKQLNNEIEAKIGWLLERKRNKKSTYADAISGAFYDNETLSAMYSLSDHFIAGSNPSSQDYKDAYIASINGLRQLSGYKHMTISHLDYDWQFDILTILMANCPEFNI